MAFEETNKNQNGEAGGQQSSMTKPIASSSSSDKLNLIATNDTTANNSTELNRSNKLQVSYNLFI